MVTNKVSHLPRLHDGSHGIDGVSANLVMCGREAVGFVGSSRACPHRPRDLRTQQLVSAAAERGDTDLVRHLAAHLRWTSRSDRGHAAHSGGREALDRPGQVLHALNYCMLLPGPEAQQLAIYIGWLLNGIRGGLIAGTLFMLPGVAALLALSAVYVGYGDTAAVDALFLGRAPTAIAIVVQAVVRVAAAPLPHRSWSFSRSGHSLRWHSSRSPSPSSSCCPASSAGCWPASNHRWRRRNRRRPTTDQHR